MPNATKFPSGRAAHWDGRCTFCPFKMLHFGILGSHRVVVLHTAPNMVWKESDKNQAIPCILYGLVSLLVILAFLALHRLRTMASDDALHCVVDPSHILHPLRRIGFHPDRVVENLLCNPDGSISLSPSLLHSAPFSSLLPLWRKFPQTDKRCH